MNDKPTPETDAKCTNTVTELGMDNMVAADFARKLERERDSALDALTALVRAVAAYGASGQEFNAALAEAEKLTGSKGYKS
jgi:uncharacterized membrane protein